MNTITPKQSPLHNTHLSLGAKFTPFAGWEMPLNYNDGIIAEHIHTRSAVSIFDVSHMGEFKISGQNAASALDKLVPRSVITQKILSCRYNFLLTKRGTVIDDIIIYRLSENEFFIVVNAATKDKDAEWIRANLPENIHFEDISAKTAKIDLQGPLASKVLTELGLSENSLPRYYNFTFAKIANAEVLLSRTGYTGELGYEIYSSTEDAETIWNTLLSIKNVKPAGLGARDTLRIEMGYPLYGHELNEDTTPIEAGFGKLINISDERAFIGKDSLIKNPPRKKIIGIELDGRRAVRESAEIFSDKTKIGYISSGSYSPSLQKAIAIGFVEPHIATEEHKKIEIFFKKNNFQGCFSQMPFYKNGTAKN